MGGVYSEVALQKQKAEGTVHTKHQLKLDPSPEGIYRNLDARLYGGREEQRVPRGGGGAGATQGVPCDLRPLSDRMGCTVANGGASVPEGTLALAVSTSLGARGVLEVITRSLAGSAARSAPLRVTSAM